MSSPTVAVSRFPVIFHPPGGGTPVREARVIMTKPQDGVGTLIAWSAPDHEVLRATYTLDDSDIRSNQVDWTVSTDQGEVIISPQHGCGCSNRLKHWSPPEFTPMRMSRLR